MRDARFWIALLAIVSFLAGSAATVLVDKLSDDADDRGPFAAYEDTLVEEFELDPERAALLRFVLRKYAREIDSVHRAGEEELFASLRQDLESMGTEYNEIIRDYVLPPSQRARFDALAMGGPFQ